MIEIRQAVLLGATLALAASGCEEKNDRSDAEKLFAANASAGDAPVIQARNEFNPRLLRRFKPARRVIESREGADSDDQVALGHMLFHEKRLSKSQEISCNDCHRLDKHGVDGEPTSPGHRGQRGARNTPTVYHAAANFEQFWDGRAPDVEEQALGPILNPVEMAAPSKQYVVRVLSSMPDYVAAFQRAFPDDENPVTFENVGKAIGAFERRLTTRSRWDEYLEGKKSALSAKEIEGLKLFTNLGCMVCHTGELLGGSMYEKVGAVEPWPNQDDQGRYAVTKRDGDRMMFKVPTLRNVAETAPYFHDGTATALSEAVRMMGRHQLGLELEDAEVEAIVTWLKSLTGEPPRDYVARPDLPESTAQTPSADKG